MVNECWITLVSVASWTAPGQWMELFDAAENVLEAKLTHLDVHDPLRRKVDRANYQDSGGYVTRFVDQETSKVVFGRFQKAEVDFKIHFHRDQRFDERAFPNSLTIYFPAGWLGSEAKAAVRMEALFHACNRILSPFYAYSDLLSVIAAKKKSSGSVNLQQELLGVFWLTFFGGAYVKFFGAERLTATGCGVIHPERIVLKLADTPAACSLECRRQVEVQLGAASFVDPRDNRFKRWGVHALKFEAIRDAL